VQLSLPYRNAGISGRATYHYDKRYYTEFNFGYNGSERFDARHRFGFFPSVGLAWTASNEAFMKKLSPLISNLRFRATYGLIGNDAIGSPEDRFFYLSNVNMNDAGRRATFGRDPGAQYGLNGISISRYANENITWETSTQKNIAMELGIHDKLNFNLEYFSQYRDQILMTRGSIPLEAGFNADIRANVGEASGQGLDLSMDYKEYLRNDIWLSGLGNFTYATSKFTVYEEPRFAEAYRYHVGNPIYQTYGYIAERLFVDDAEAANSPLQSFGEYGGGDIKYLDVNRDGKVTEADKVPIGKPTMPEIVYGFGFSAGFKGMDLSAFFQGMANTSFWIDTEATAPFVNENQLLKAYADSYWSEEHRDVYALWPRLSASLNQNNNQTSTWFMRDGSFLRLKQVELGYTLPAHIQKKIHTSTCRIYVNASNLLTFSKFKLWDVEMGGNGLGYPIQKVVNIGLNLNIN
jgi:TonB-linked SusC/RagA family outer membrane protein